MGDIASVWQVETGTADWGLAGADLTKDQDLATAVLISVFTDRRADPDDGVPDGSDDRRGWWGDDGADYPIGSKVWLRVRSKQTDATLKLVEGDLRQALQWLIDRKVVAALDVATEWTKPGLLGAKVTLHRDGQPPATLTYAWVWQGI